MSFSPFFFLHLQGKMKPAPKNLPQSEGIYYIVRHVRGWALLPYRYATREELDHVHFWDQELVHDLSLAWAKTLGLGVSEIESRIRNCSYAFPRGRIVKHGKRFTVFHGDDVERGRKISRRAIENWFGIAGKADWKQDEHERCQREDKEIVRHLFKIQENWKDAD